MWGKVLLIAILYHLLPWNRFLWSLLFLFIIAWVWTSGGKYMSLRRKVAIGTWKPQKDSAMNAVVAIDVTNATKFMEKQNSKGNGAKLSITVLVGKAMALALKEMPHVNGKIVFGRFVPRETVDICFLVAVPDSKNLGYVTMIDVPKMSLNQMAESLTKNASSVRSGKDVTFKANMDVAAMLPTFVLGPIMAFLAFISNCLGFGIKAVGLNPNSFGSFTITSIGAFGFDEAFAPTTSMYHHPGVATVCAIKQKPVVMDDGKIEARPIMKITFTVDHRYLDGHESSIVMKKLMHFLEKPEEML
jgi:pyruvate dehydrogenase E2 component (dihydrolipoamide acetyltransferase)